MISHFKLNHFMIICILVSWNLSRHQLHPHHQLYSSQHSSSALTNLAAIHIAASPAELQHTAMQIHCSQQSSPAAAMSAAASTAALQQTAQQLSNIAATDYVGAATIFQTAAPTS